MNLRDQLAWERECVDRGLARYYDRQDKMRESGSADETDSFSLLIRQRLEEVEKKIEKVANTTKGGGGKYNKLLKSVTLEDNYFRVAYIGLKTVIQLVMAPHPSTPLKLTKSIAGRLEMDWKCAKFELEKPGYYATVMKSMKDQKVTDYDHVHKVFSAKFREFRMGWDDWSDTVKVQVGSRVLRAILETFDDILFINKKWSKGKWQYTVETTAAFDEWSGEFERERGFLYPYYLPLKIKPAKYKEHRGGYYSGQMELDLIKTRGTAAKEFVSQHDCEAHVKAIDKMAGTAWEINKRVLDVQNEVWKRGLGIGIPSSLQVAIPQFPEHLAQFEKGKIPERYKDEVIAWKQLAKMAYGREQERRGQVLGFSAAHKLAQELSSWEEFYFAYNCDFRGRIYCATTGLSPQGQDSAKGLLRFKERVALGESGIRWLAIHGANVYGYDKASYGDRVAYIQSLEDQLRQAYADPIGFSDVWAGADKPYQFLAFIFEWGDCDFGRDPRAYGQIPVGLDGSCNGIQHYSAMLRDEVGARSVNLIDGELPNDIYGDVAKETERLLKEMDEPMAHMWLNVNFDRKLTKRPVMTLPYGSTQTSCRAYILEWVHDNWHKFDDSNERNKFEYAKYLTPIVWKAIGNVVIAARAAMDWLKKQVGTEYCKWVTPVGFPVYQHYQKAPMYEIKTQILGRLSIWDTNWDSEEAKPHSAKQKSGIAPNFIHSIDNAHLVMTANDTDYNSYAFIHDDFGTHAGNTADLYWKIRETFYDLYTKSSLLTEWAEQVGADTDTLPAAGNLDINEVLTSTYFFG